jgi:hypothetical protein
MQEGGSSAEDIAAVTGHRRGLGRRSEAAAGHLARGLGEDVRRGEGQRDRRGCGRARRRDRRAEGRARAPGGEAKAEPQSAEAAAGASKKIKIKVDGQEQEVDESAVLEAGMRTLQKESAADKRLEEATKARDEAERLRKRVEETLAAGRTGRRPRRRRRPIRK